ncbi:TetR/AcrR family transcriptional regulator [Streptomyces apricus]|uniref:TetR/AcrR family transcriptional regulator n=1 Tax=Streptomyces apricus TaxID=1828112 RepID=A0A5B0ASQ5_9ACTN|nr:TetR/AcrR family transcriptional regulator [Streptomyces apricus]KAA0932980.1 TetR/AcrR family transcriptional regulator [Streptomyces apricus]
MRPPRCAPRSDARANRARIVEAGRSVFDGDRSAGLQAVAKAAGVGQGTLYRHFPDREALLLAVYEEEVAALAADAAHLLSGHGPLEALRLWFERLAAHAHGTYGASLAVAAATSSS